MGSIQSIIIRPEKKGTPMHITDAEIHDCGITGDHALKPESKRHVTLISSVALAEVAANVGFQGDAHAASRRNICVDALPDENLIGRRVALGDEVILEITSYCFPCNRMDENFGDGAIQAFNKKAGWGARVITQGEISVGDGFRLL